MGGDVGAARDAIVAAYRRLAAEGLLRLSTGNISVRLGDGLLCTPTGADAGLAPADLVVVGADGRVEGGGIPSSEWALHAAVYAACPEAGAVVHTHADACTALACLRRPLPAFHYMVATFGGDDVPCAPYAAFGSRRLADVTGAALADRTACLLANHGAVCRGADLADAVAAALALEMLAGQYLAALAVGEPVLLTADEMNEARRRFGYYGRAAIPEAPGVPDAPGA